MLPTQQPNGAARKLWRAWWSLARQLRPAFSRTRTFLWFALALAAISVRNDLLGVTSLVRALGLQERCYHRLLECFHSRALDLQALALLCPAVVWKQFGSWLRTIRPGILPSEFVVALALRHSPPEFLAASPQDHALALFIRQRLDLGRTEGLRLAA